ncbi:uncharacterized protein EDB93DRAFT_111505 [Suillus bovinus]|uniref:uncharacterized protein n=1 Tax=Suillus bovinus TaxID=48563 RepID=UPI001B8782BB|nr:uncharacterized protein EDB93DRAFT_111505 [Suillus bovinus]KAG2129725.1 hypothetical protein EDB93DRAFT_111505 [Suillus bovinus]
MPRAYCSHPTYNTTAGLYSFDPSLGYMVRCQRATFESLYSSQSDSNSDLSSASSRETSPTPPVEKPAPDTDTDTEPLEGRKRKRKSSGNDNDNKTKCSKLPRLQKADNEEPSYPELTKDPGEIHISGVQQVVITAIHATDLTLGLRRIPAGFHTVVKADGIEYQTSNKSVHVDQAVLEWQERILL